MSSTHLPLDRIEHARRLSGLKYTALAELTDISYKRLWRFFRDDGSLTRQETLRLEAVLEEALGIKETADVGSAASK